MICQVINVWDIHELRHFICLNIKCQGVKSETHSISSTKAVFLDATTRENLVDSVIESKVNGSSCSICSQY